jgi:hypothetical protein
MRAWQALMGAAVVLAMVPATGETARAAGRADCAAVQTEIQAALDAACPCDAATSHGTYVRCIARKLRELSACSLDADSVRRCGPVPRGCIGKIRRVASRATCGKADSVTCCMPKQHDCVGDPAPGDGKKEGTCSGTKRPCDRVTDCLLSSCHLAPNAEHCRLAGGTLGRGKHCRSACD